MGASVGRCAQWTMASFRSEVSEVCEDDGKSGSGQMAQTFFVPQTRKAKMRYRIALRMWRAHLWAMRILTMSLTLRMDALQWHYQQRYKRMVPDMSTMQKKTRYNKK